MLAALEFMALDLCLAVFAFTRPWAALVVLVALLPFNGIITRVVPVILLLPVPGQLALAGWHDALIAGIIAAAAWGLASRRYDARQLGPTGVAGGIVLVLGIVYVVI